MTKNMTVISRVNRGRKILIISKRESSSYRNESHHHFKTSIIFIIYHFEKIIIPIEKRIDLEMTLEIMIIITSKRKSYLILAEGQHDGQAQRIPGVCSKPRYYKNAIPYTDTMDRSTAEQWYGKDFHYRLNPITSALDLSTENISKQIFFSRVFHDSNDEPACHRSGVLPQIFVNNLKLKSATQPATFRQLCKSDLLRYSSSSLGKPLPKLPLLPVLMV